jgi:hypothetical protein
MSSVPVVASCTLERSILFRASRYKTLREFILLTNRRDAVVQLEVVFRRLPLFFSP